MANAVAADSEAECERAGRRPRVRQSKLSSIVLVAPNEGPPTVRPIARPDFSAPSPLQIVRYLLLMQART